MRGDDLAAQRHQQVDVGDVEIARRNRFEQQAAGDAVGAEAPLRLRQLGAEKSERAHFLGHFALDAARGLARAVAGFESLLREAAGGVHHRLLFLREGEIHAAFRAVRPEPV